MSSGVLLGSPGLRPSPAQCQALSKPGQHLGAGSACLASQAWSGVAWFGTHTLILAADPLLHLPHGFAWLSEYRPQITFLASSSDLFLLLQQCPDNVMDLPGQPSTGPEFGSGRDQSSTSQAQVSVDFPGQLACPLAAPCQAQGTTGI